MENTETQVRATLHNICWHLGIEIDPTEYNNALTDIGVDSLDLIELVMEVEKKFNIHLIPAEIDLLGTFNDLQNIITQKLQHEI